jgi:hypothetical protein
VAADRGLEACTGTVVNWSVLIGIRGFQVMEMAGEKPVS